MNTSSNHILDTIISEVNSINEKVKGLNYLEILKNNLIEKFLEIYNQNSYINELDQIEKEVNSESRDIKISIKFLKNLSIISKRSIEENTLFLSFNESSSFDIYENEKDLYAEQVLYLPEIWNTHCGFDFEREENSPPLLKNNYITFGSFNNPSKINENVIMCWAKILENIKNSKLIIKCPSDKQQLVRIKKSFEDRMQCQ